jgi:alkanesulfonate monooxygenase SsuD/methylene tetrahydromethanopterin reductase-like flavin-dependent oxidoreductase (luciferase family)
VRDQFFMSNMVPTVVSEDLDAAYAIHRKTLTGYVSLPNYRNYWRVAGYDKEMDNIESIIATTPKESLAEQLQQAMTDEWLRDCTISGNASQVREQFSAWAQAGVLPIAVMSSTSGGQAKAVAELFAAFES